MENADLNELINSLVEDATEHSGIDRAASIHWLRHAHASIAIDTGARRALT